MTPGLVRGDSLPVIRRRVPDGVRRMPQCIAVLLSCVCCARGAPIRSEPAAAVAFAAPTALSMAVHARYRAGLDTVAQQLDALAAVVNRSPVDAAWASDARARFIDARVAYKRVEALFEFESGATALELNGAAVPETEENDGIRTPVPPTGFQVVEGALFPLATLEDSASVRAQVELMQSLVIRARAFASAGALTEMNLFDAVRLQIARVSVLAMANADSPVAELGLVEGANALLGIRNLCVPLRGTSRVRAPREWSAWDSTLVVALSALRVADSRTLDRLELTRVVLIPLAERWSALRVALGVLLPPDARPWRAAVASIFDHDAFDVWQFAPSYARTANPLDAAALGATLFSDTRLSGDGTRSCVTCHDPSRAFTDGRPRSAARRATVKLRNAPTLINAALQRAQFADARAAFLEDQVTDVVQNTHELGGALHDYAKRLGADPAMRARFSRSFGQAGDSTVTPVRVAQALAAYERTLIALDAPFDRYLRGDTAAMPSAARRGYSVFMGQGKCGTCHFAPLFNGTVPPVFARSEVEIIGTPAVRGWRHTIVDSDSGRARIYSSSGYLRAFKTPTLRNVAVTGPYMHNGVYRTLPDVVEFYARGGGAGLGLDVPNQTLPFDKLLLSARDKRDLVAFMRALTDARYQFTTASELPRGTHVRR